MCGGDCWEIKDQIGEKKIDRGPEIFGGGLFGEMTKKGWKNFLVVPKSGGNFFGGENNFLGENFSGKKKKIPGAILWKIFKKKFRGDFLGGSYTGGRVWGKCWEIKDKIGEKKISGGQKFGGALLGEMQKKGGKTFLGEFWGSCEPQQILGAEILGGTFGGNEKGVLGGVLGEL